MEKYRGLKIAPGIAGGYLCIINSHQHIEHNKISHRDVKSELQQFRTTLSETEKELSHLSAQVTKELGKDEAAIFQVQQMMVKDPYFLNQIEHKISVDRKSLGWSIEETLEEAYRTMQQLDDSYFRERINDFRDVTHRLLKHILASERQTFLETHKDIVIAAENLLPSHTVSLPRNKIVAFITEHGGLTGHAAILSRSLGVPLVSGISELFKKANIGDEVIVNGYYGEVILNPTAKQYASLQRIKSIIQKRVKERKKIARLVTKTKDGEKVSLFANIGSFRDAKDARQMGAKGVGLYRTEMYFLNREEPASEEEQYLDYKRIADYFYPDPVVIRTMDLGGDKFKAGKPGQKEPNPYLGCRAIRISLRQPEIFKTQIRAILRAGVNGNVKIMFPMITCIEEVYEIKKFISSAKKELKKSNKKYDETMPAGIMVEVPSVAIDIASYLPHVDFISVGTNDLVQYTLAVDRGNESISNMYQPLNPSVLYLLNHISQQARLFEKEASICGEMAGTSRYTDLLLGMGYRNLSMSAPFLLHVKMRIRSIHMKETSLTWEKMKTLTSASKIEDFIEKHFSDSLDAMMLDSGMSGEAE